MFQTFPLKMTILGRNKCKKFKKMFFEDFPLYLRDGVTCIMDEEVSPVSGRLNPGKLV